jgi:hypothetical protein
MDARRGSEGGCTPDSRQAIERGGQEIVSAKGIHSPQKCGIAGMIRLRVQLSDHKCSFDESFYCNQSRPLALFAG